MKSRSPFAPLVALSVMLTSAVSAVGAVTIRTAAATCACRRLSFDLVVGRSRRSVVRKLATKVCAVNEPARVRGRDDEDADRGGAGWRRLRARSVRRGEENERDDDDADESVSHGSSILPNG